MEQWQTLIGVLFGGLIGFVSTQLVIQNEKKNKKRELINSKAEELYSSLSSLYFKIYRSLRILPLAVNDFKHLDDIYEEIHDLFGKTEMLLILYFPDFKQEAVNTLDSYNKTILEFERIDLLIKENKIKLRDEENINQEFKKIGELLDQSHIFEKKLCSDLGKYLETINK